MDILKIAVLGVCGMMTALLVKELKTQFAVVISVTVCVVIIFYAITRLGAVAAVLGDLTNYISMHGSYMEILLKIVGIAYIADFSSSICKDAGFQAISGQIEIFGKIAILTISTPIVTALLDTISEFLG